MESHSSPDHEEGNGCKGVEDVPAVEWTLAVRLS
jgi:hypothetical protein